MRQTINVGFVSELVGDEQDSGNFYIRVKPVIRRRTVMEAKDRKAIVDAIKKEAKRK